MRTLKNLQERKEKRRKALEQNLPRAVEQLKSLGALRVILFGSLVRGNVGPGSDLDIIAVTDCPEACRRVFTPTPTRLKKRWSWPDECWKWSRAS